MNEYMFKLNKAPVYFDKGLDPEGGLFYEKIHASGGMLCILDEEGGSYPQSGNDLLIRNSEIALKHVDLLFLWGTDQKREILKHRHNIREEQLIVTGHPRFDLRKPPYTEFYRSIRNNSTFPSNRYILFNTNFSYINSFITSKQIFDIKKVSNQELFSEELFKRNIHYESLYMSYFVEAVRFIAKAFPSLTIVVRPHPGENPETHRDTFRDLSNVLVSNEGSVHEWIIDALAVIHHDCTTAVETFLYGKYPVSYCPVFAKELVQVLPVQVSDKIDSKEELLKYINAIIEGAEPTILSDIKRDRLEKIRCTIANVDYESSGKIVAGLIPHLDRCKYRRSAKAQRSAEHIQKRIMKRFVTALWRFDSTARRKEIHRHNKFPGIQLDEMNKRIELLQRCNSSIPKSHIQEIDKDTFLISPVESS